MKHTLPCILKIRLQNYTYHLTKATRPFLLDVFIQGMTFWVNAMYNQYFAILMQTLINHEKQMSCLESGSKNGMENVEI
jgi:hypothetical protein